MSSNADDITLNGDAQSDMRAELDDERRDVPDGWVRAFDRKSGHHFYATDNGGQSTWTHPYDLPAYVNSLPKEHPANPKSQAGKMAAEKLEAEKQKRAEEPKEEKKGWLGKTVGKLVGGEGTSPEEKRAIKDVEENFRQRKEALLNGKIDAVGTKRKYAEDPFGYTAPTEPFDRYASWDIKYAFGYQGSYQRKYHPSLGYDRIGKPSAGMVDTALKSWILGQSSGGPGNPAQNYGF